MKAITSKFFIVLILLELFFCLPSFSNEQKEPSLSVTEEEEAAVTHLILTTEERLKVQKQLQELMIKFKRQKKQFSEGNSSKKEAFQMVKTASEILKLVHDQHLQHLFSPIYLEELNLFSSIAGKNTPVRP